MADLAALTNRQAIYCVERGIQLSLLDTTLCGDLTLLDLASAQRNGEGSEKYPHRIIPTNFWNK